MEALYLLVPVSVGIVFAAIWVFFRMSDSGQFDDLEGPALRVLQDDDDGGGENDDAAGVRRRQGRDGPRIE